MPHSALSPELFSSPGPLYDDNEYAPLDWDIQSRQESNVTAWQNDDNDNDINEYYNATMDTEDYCKVSYAVTHGKHSHMGVLVIPSRSPREPKSPLSLAQVPCACHCFSALPSHAPRSFKELSLYPYFSFVLLAPSFTLSLSTPMHSCVHGLTLV